MSVTDAVSPDLQRELENTLYAEAELLDDNKFREWLDWLTDDLEYIVPVRVTREREAPTDIISGMTHMEDQRSSMEMRILRLETEYAWAEDPPSRVRHHLSNVRVAATDNPDEFEVKSNLLLYRSRGDSPEHDLLSAERKDLWRRVEGTWKLARRVANLDQTVLATHNLAVIL
jgi:3-phenylpropionate/cinnamic acid dioxygenase small subunit